MRWVNRLIAICFLTASCDIILNVHIGGSIRLCQAIMVLICLAAVAHSVQYGTVLWARGSSSIALWMLIQLALIPLSGAINVGIQFYVLLLFTVIGVFAIVQLYGTGDNIEFLMKAYMASYVAVAVAGLVQFALPLAGLPSFLVIQWISHGRIARINGFNYEPSYFATYMIMGWVMLVELRNNRAHIASGRWWRLGMILVTVALLLSTSKTAWIMMLLELTLRFSPYVYKGLRSILKGMFAGRIMVLVPGARFLRNAFLVTAVLLVFGVFVSRSVSFATLFLSGTGLGHQPAHSLNDRTNATNATIAAFKEHPFVGRSLGGVPVYIASRNGVSISTVEQARQFWGFPVLMDVMVASGIFGFIPFLFFMYANTFGALRVARRHWPQERAKWVHALARAMIFEWLTLLADQNLLRVYLWFHIAMVAAVAYHLEFATAPNAIPQPYRPPSNHLQEASA